MNLPYSENFTKLNKGDIIIFECLEDVPEGTPLKKGTIQKWKVVEVIVTPSNLPSEHPGSNRKSFPLGFTASRTIKGLPKQTVRIFNHFIKDDIFNMPKGLFMPFPCKYKVYIEKNSDKVNPFKKLFKI